MHDYLLLTDNFFSLQKSEKTKKSLWLKTYESIRLTQWAKRKISGILKESGSLTFSLHPPSLFLTQSIGFLIASTTILTSPQQLGTHTASPQSILLILTGKSILLPTFVMSLSYTKNLPSIEPAFNTRYQALCKCFTNINIPSQKSQQEIGILRDFSDR